MSTRRLSWPRRLRSLARPARLLAAAAAALASTAAPAALTTLDFEGVPSGSYFSNLTVSGLRFSPTCHVDVVPSGGFLSGYQGSQWLGFDSSGCGPGNPDFLGAAVYAEHAPAVFVDLGGLPFSFESVFINRREIEVQSSKGGLFTQSCCGAGSGLFDFSGGRWHGIDWLLFVNRGDVGVPFGIDQLTVRAPAHAVAEPPALLALALAMLALLGATARRPQRRAG